MKAIIIGGSHAGISAANYIKQLDPAYEVLLIERTPELSFIPSTINLINQDRFSIQEIEKGSLTTVQDLEANDISVMLQTAVTAIDFEQQTVHCHQQETDEKFSVSYDSLVLAMGSSRYRLANFEENPYLDHLTTYKKKAETQTAFEQLQDKDHLAIIGAGLIGLEAASSWASTGTKKITLIEQNNRPLFRYFDHEITDVLLSQIPDSVQFFLGKSFRHAEPVGDQLQLECFDGTSLLCDRAIFALNPKPEVELVKEQLTLDFDQSILVNDAMETSVAHVYAIGDLVRIPFGPLGEKAYLPLISNARKTAFVAASQITGRHTTVLPPTQRTIGTHLFGLYLGSVGLTAEEADYYGLPYATMTKRYTRFAKYEQPDDLLLKLKLIYNQENQQLLGVQLISNRKDQLDILNAIPQLITDGKTLEALLFMDIYFNPELSASINFWADIAAACLENEA